MKKIFFILFMVLSSIIYGQSFNRHDNLNVRILNDTILRPFDSNPVTSIGISGHVSFTSELGFVRFVVNDNNDNEYMIYESYCLFEDTISFNFSQKCEESCFYESYTPTEISVQVKDAIIIVNSVDLSNAQYSNAESLRKTAAATSNNQKLIKVKDYIQSKGLIWVASQTRLSSLSYQQKSDLFGKDYKTYGYEFYSKGFFSIFGPERYSSSKNFVHNFDWRNRHGANDSLSLYYDGDTLGTGWITPIVCQGNGCWINGCFDCYMDSVQCNQLGGEYRAVPTCWIFGPTAQVEALTNLYYNQHIDVDLSEQYIACKENTISQNYPHVALRHYKREGVPLESCLPYSASLNNCDDLCSDSLVRVSIDTCISHSHFNTTDSLLKQYLINKGPLTAASLPLGFGMNKHCMALIGWGTIDDDIAKEVLGVPIDENGNYDTGFLGLTYWIYKQSNGIDVGDNGFMYILHINDDVPDITYSIPTPIHYNNMTESDVRCNDYDGDGYYNWGIGPKPAHCPSCPDEPDGDDSNPNLGPLNSYGQCTIIGTYNASFEDGWDNWMQVETLFEDNGIFWRHSNPPSSTLTGPSNAQDGDYYIYINSRAMVNYNHSTSCIESPDINIQDSCYNYLDFYYHMKIYDWHSGEENPYIMLSTQKANNTWSSSYPKWIEYGDHGSDWQHATILLPTDVKKVRLYVETGTYQYSDIAIDNITIGPWTYNDSAIVINDSITWTENKIINTDIIVDNGGCLTIKKATGNKLNIKLHPNSKIIVKPGGKLIIDRSRLTCACPGQMWRGIEVWGDSSQDQQPHHGDYHQGYLEMKNGATIENAVCAVELWHPGYYNTTGGIINATDAVFRNNAMAVHGLYYVDHDGSGNEIAYNAQFTKCSFIIDSNYLGTETFYKHVDLADVKSVYFSGCDFSVAPNVSGVSDYCMGIGAYGAGFLVKSYCEEPNMHPSCPESDIVRCTFEGFNNGILCVNEGNSARSFSVKDASFVNNNRGIFAQNTGFANIIGNEFSIGRNSSCGYGIYADGVANFCIEENSFTPATGTLGEKYGIGIFNSAGSNGVYLNTFNGLTCGNVAYGVNHTADLSGRPPAVIPGLKYLCNDNSGNDIDFCVLKDNGTGGIASPQGTSTEPAGNTFSGYLYHFYNDGEFDIEYYYNQNGTGETPTASKLYHVNASPSTYSNSCTSHYGGGGVVRSSAEKATLAEAYRTADNAYSTLVNVYNSQIAAGTTPSEALISDMAKSLNDRTMAAGDIVRSCLNENVTDAAELRLWLGNMHDIASDRMTVASYIQQGDFTNALALANTLPVTYNLHDDGLSDHNGYMVLLNLYQTLYNSNRTVNEMTLAESAMVKDLAENGVGTSQQMARAIIMEINDRYVEPFICPDMPRPNRETAADIDYDAKPENDTDIVVSIAPIPATTWVSVSYKLPEDKSKATMAVVNSLGIKVLEAELDGTEGTKTLDLHEIPAGVYTYIVHCGEYTDTGKLVITKE